MINILVVDDLQSIRARLEYLIQSVADFNLIGSAENGQEAIAQIKLLQPDVVLLDMELPDISGITVTKLVSQDFPQVKILVLSSHDKSEYVTQAMSAGAMGYLLKGSFDEEIEQAIRFVHQGCTHLSAGLFAKMLPVVKQSSLVKTPSVKSELTLPPSAILAKKNTFDKNSPKQQILAWLIVTLGFTTGIYAFRQWLRQPLPALNYTQQAATLADTKFSGKLEPAKTFKIAAVNPGVIDNVYVQVGDRVEVGQPLLTIKNLSAQTEKKQIIQEQQFTKQQQQAVLQQQQTARQRIQELEQQIDRLKYNLAPLKAKIAEANLQVSLAQSQADKLPLRQRQDSVPRTKALYDRASAHFQRIEKLYQQGAISLDKLEQAESELEITRLDYDMAIAASAANTELAQNQSQLSQLESKLALQEQQEAIALLEKQQQTANLKYQQATSKLALLAEQAAQLNKYQVPEINKVVKATEAGIVAEVPVAVGEQIYSGNPVIELANLDLLRVSIPVNARLINALSPEQTAIVQLGSGVTTQEFEGKIATVNPIPNQKLDYLVEVEFINPTNAILVGQLAQVQFIPQTIAGEK